MATGLQSLLENTAGLSHELLFEADLSGALLFVNPVWARVLGCNETELESLYDLVHRDDLENVRQAIGRGIESATVFPLEARFRRKDGAYRRVAWSLLAQRNVLRGAGHDVTAMGEAYAQVGHDINNLMQTIIGALELVRRMQQTGRIGETERFMINAIQSAHRAAELNQQRVGSFPAPAKKAVDESADL